MLDCSAITGGPAAKYDKHLLDEGCSKKRSTQISKSQKRILRKKVQIGGYRMKEKVIRFEKSPIHGKKYGHLLEITKQKG